MRLRSFGRKTLLGGALLIVPLLGVSVWLITSEQRRVYNEHLRRQMHTTVRLLRDATRDAWHEGDAAALAPLVHTLVNDGATVLLVSADGQVLVDTSDGDLAGGFLERPEVDRALRSGWDDTTQTFPGDPHESYVVAVRAGDDADTLGVVWLARPMWTVAATWHSLGKIIATVAALALIGTVLVFGLLVRQRTRLMRRLIRAARALSAGDLSSPVAVSGSDEYAALSAALNRMRTRLALHVDTIDRQRRTLESLVDQLHEGVVVVRPDGRLTLLNPAAVSLLRLSPPRGGDFQSLVGEPLERVIPLHDLQNMLRAGSASAEPERQETRLQIEGDGLAVHLLARAFDVELPDDERGRGPSQGRMLVLTDITELTRIIQVKTDFVANASHELRTPLATIRAGVETLLGIDLPREPETAMRFLEKVDRQTRRLEALVSDLLSLSQLESARAKYTPQRLAAAQERGDLASRFAQRIADKRIHFQTGSAPGAGAALVANAHLLRLVLDNLVDNALKFTPPGGSVVVTHGEDQQWVSFTVRDTGCGIPEEEQRRVFERFYQVERARAGEERGTGLGLSIVRHAVATMGGSVTLESAPGRGTTVTVRLPREPRTGRQGTPAVLANP